MEARMKGNLIWSCDVHATMKADSLLDLLENFIKCALGRTRLVSMRMEEWTHKLSFSGHPEVPWEHPPPWLLQSAGLSPQGISVWCLLMPTLWCCSSYICAELVLAKLGVNVGLSRFDSGIQEYKAVKLVFLGINPISWWHGSDESNLGDEMEPEDASSFPSVSLWILRFK